jgi:hypothetical protein
MRNLLFETMSKSVQITSFTTFARTIPDLSLGILEQQYSFHNSSSDLQIPTQRNYSRASIERSGNEAAEILSAIRIGHSPDGGVFGASSNIAFVQHITNAVEPASSPMDRGLDPRTVDSEESSLSARQQETRESSLAWDIISAALPDKKVADNLMKCFWDYIHPIFPIVHQPTIENIYENLWTASKGHSPALGDSIGKAVLYSTIDIILALGCQYYVELLPQQRLDLANQMYEKSRKSVSIDTLDTTSLPILQLLLLTGVYLQGTRYANRCWNIVGIAIRVAQGLGLHLDIGHKTESQLDQEMRRRVWHTCVMLDR